MKRPTKPKISEPRRPRKPKAPGKYLTLDTIPSWKLKGALATRISAESTAVVMEQGDFKIRITKRQISVMVKDDKYTERFVIYKGKMATYNEEMVQLAPKIAIYDKAMKKYELEMARYVADNAEKALLKAKADYYD